MYINEDELTSSLQVSNGIYKQLDLILHKSWYLFIASTCILIFAIMRRKRKDLLELKSNKNNFDYDQESDEDFSSL